MSVGTLLFGAITFGAGVAVGVVLGEKGIVTTSTLEDGCRYVVDQSYAAGKKVREALAPEMAPATPQASSSGWRQQ